MHWNHAYRHTDTQVFTGQMGFCQFLQPSRPKSARTKKSKLVAHRHEFQNALIRLQERFPLAERITTDDEKRVAHIAPDKFLHPRDFERKFDRLCATCGIDGCDTGNDARLMACISHWPKGQVEPLHWCRIQDSQCEADFP